MIEQDLSVGVPSRTCRSFFLGFALTIATGCESTLPSKELADARQAYDKARVSQAPSLVPKDLLTARQALDRAERASKEDPGSFKEAALAYVAERRAELALVNAHQAALQMSTLEARRTYVRLQDVMRKRAQREAAASASELEQTQRELEQAKLQLAGISQVTSKSRGLVITLEGAVLFGSGRSELLPGARERLARVAQLLRHQTLSRRLVVEGHTDSVGSEESNVLLSEQRARAVRGFLVSEGIAEQRIQAIGKGETEPVASNASPEGRASNRRVEIVLE